MKTLRHYFIADELKAIEHMGERMADAGVPGFQLHVLTRSEAEAETLNLPLVNSLMKRDLVHSLMAGATVGAVTASFIIAVTALLGLPGPVIGWTPYVCLAIVAFGFCTWEGGLIGMEEPNRMLRDFDHELNQGRHVFFADITPDQKNFLITALDETEGLTLHKLDIGKPRWVVNAFNWLTGFTHRNLMRLS